MTRLFQTTMSALSLIMTVAVTRAAPHSQFAFIGTKTTQTFSMMATNRNLQRASILSQPSKLFLGRNTLVMKMSEDGSSSSSSSSSSSQRLGKRRKRKDGLNRAPPSPEKEEEATTEKEGESEISGKAPETVEMQVMDVRDVLSGKTAPSPSSSTPSTTTEDQTVEDVGNEFEEEWEEVDDDEEENDEYEYVYVDDDDEEEETTAPTSSSMAKLKAAAKRMREAEKEAALAAQQEAYPGDESESSGGVQIPDGVKNALSTIVTVDFFVVLGLLAWFLAGIFCSYILKNDAVQIAFNSNFEMIVQPALGILMIGSAASAVLDKEEE